MIILQSANTVAYFYVQSKTSHNFSHIPPREKKGINLNKVSNSVS